MANPGKDPSSGQDFALPGAIAATVNKPGKPPPRVALEHKVFSEDDIRDAFQSFDLDKNGYVCDEPTPERIGASELRHVLSLIGERASDAEIDEMIAMCDPDGDGQASFPAFRALFTRDPHNIDVARKGPQPQPRELIEGSTRTRDAKNTMKGDNGLGNMGTYA
ncbi:calmodulin, putative [Perkinsus marinus ATCC 50983]|uniref:Calmodulin, putative n=1 Tax=Perkinsus marinus (strain ATCC 50983 / TXsc) TaxID=423536 RepID=C5KCN7_PERM5|nr:calmodulin, putative [Perkinsus marinus ATCC 50983]EER17636.1 calmodulin, putative [Perkinsus marinus ATCC 50983]|eukprot:XP_002785840.1 calmodulin, putative [Perkinsus marinus ATCC 50983]